MQFKSLFSIISHLKILHSRSLSVHVEPERPERSSGEVEAEHRGLYVSQSKGKKHQQSLSPCVESTTRLIRWIIPQRQNTFKLKLNSLKTKLMLSDFSVISVSGNPPWQQILGRASCSRHPQPLGRNRTIPDTNTDTIPGPGPDCRNNYQNLSAKMCVVITRF